MFGEILYNIGTSISTNLILMKTLRWSKWFVYGLMTYLLYKHIDNFNTIDIMISSIIIWVGIANIIYLTTIIGIIKELKKTISKLETDLKTPPPIMNDDDYFLNDLLKNMKPGGIDDSSELPIEEASNEELDKRLKIAVKEEKYELANKIALEIEKRKK
jgi:hypothetical protein